MRLVRAIVTVLIAVSMAVFPLAMPQAAAVNGSHHSHATEVVAGHSHSQGVKSFEAASAEKAGAAATRSSLTCDGPAGQDGHGDASCCGGVLCHAFELSAAPSVSVPVSRRVTLAMGCRQQVTDGLTSQIERPPRFA